MKKLITGFVCIVLLGICTSVNAQIKDDARRAGHKTAEVASRTKSAVVDKIYRDKEGPRGEKIYIDKHDKCYWIDKRGRKQYIAKSRLREKHRRD